MNRNFLDSSWLVAVFQRCMHFLLCLGIMRTCVCMYVYIYICCHVYIYIYIFLYIHDLFLYLHINIHIMCVYIYNIYLYILYHVYIYIYTVEPWHQSKTGSFAQQMLTFPDFKSETTFSKLPFWAASQRALHAVSERPTGPWRFQCSKKHMLQTKQKHGAKMCQH